jgi:undecaprenyl-diphosphatase
MGFTMGSKYGSFPSAHTTGAFALAAGLSWFYPNARGLFVGLAVVTAGQRILHHAHYLSDVFAGIILGVGVTRMVLGRMGMWALPRGSEAA